MFSKIRGFAACTNQKIRRGFSCKQSSLVRRCQSFLPGRLPDSKAEPDLVHEVSHVVDEVQRSIIHGTQEVSEEVSQRVDGPSNGDDEAHHVEGGLDGLGRTLDALSTLTCEDLEQNEAPAGHAQCEANVGVDDLSLTEVTEEQHADGAEEETEEHAGAKVWLHCGKDQVELNHLQRHGQRPIDEAVHDWAHVNLHPVLAHVEVVHSRNEGDKGPTFMEVFQADLMLKLSIKKKQ